MPIDCTHDPQITVGPGTYEPKAIERHINVPKIDPKTGFSLPFNEKNPLNYVKPITVNIYFKENCRQWPFSLAAERPATQ